MIFPYETNAITLSGKKSSKAMIYLLVIGVLGLFLLGIVNTAQGIECNDREGCTRIEQQ